MDEQSNKYAPFPSADARDRASFSFPFIKGQGQYEFDPVGVSYSKSSLSTGYFGEGNYNYDSFSYDYQDQYSNDFSTNEHIFANLNPFSVSFNPSEDSAPENAFDITDPNAAFNEDLMSPVNESGNNHNFSFNTSGSKSGTIFQGPHDPATKLLRKLKHFRSTSCDNFGFASVSGPVQSPTQTSSSRPQLSQIDTNINMNSMHVRHKSQNFPLSAKVLTNHTHSHSHNLGGIFGPRSAIEGLGANEVTGGFYSPFNQTEIAGLGFDIAALSIKDEKTDDSQEKIVGNKLRDSDSERFALSSIGSNNNFLPISPISRADRSPREKCDPQKSAAVDRNVTSAPLWDRGLIISPPHSPSIKKESKGIISNGSTINITSISSVSDEKKVWEGPPS